MIAAMILLQASGDSDIGSLVTQLLSDLQGKLWIAAIPVAILLVLAVLRKFGVLGGAKPADPAPAPAPVDAAKAKDLLDGKS